MDGQFDGRQVTLIRSQQPNVSWISEVKGKRRMGDANASAETGIIRRGKRSEDELSEELLEGIPNEVTLIHIAAKLPYRAWQIAGSLSPDWHRAFKGGMVYNARVCSQATETFVAVLFNFSKRYRRGYHKGLLEKRTLSLFSPSEERWYKLPPIPGWPGGMPTNTHCQFAALDSCIYVLGGTRSGKDFPTAEVFVLDLATPPLEWRRCADMQIQRRNFRVGVMYGKVFVFGGFYDNFSECSNEAYDPKLNAWSWIAPVNPRGYGRSCFVVTEAWSIGQQLVCDIELARNLAPNPAEWRARDYTPSSSVERLFVQDGPRGPYLRRLSPNHRFAVDQMDGLHEMVDNQRFDKVGRLPLTPDEFAAVITAAGRLASVVELEKLYPDHKLWTYDPVNDDWGVYEFRNVDPNTVDSWDYPIHKRDLFLPCRDGSSHVDTQVWKMSF